MQEVKSHLDFCFESLSRHIQFNFRIKCFTSSLKLLKRVSLNSSALILTIAVLAYLSTKKCQVQLPTFMES